MNNFLSRGGLWVIGQFALLAIVGAITYISRGSLSVLAGWPGIALGAAISLLAVAIGVKSAVDLGSALTALPEPLREATLVQTGVYAYVRHPIYLAVFLLVLGWAVMCASWQGVVLTAIVVAFFSAKAGVEERMLSARYPDYAAYRHRVGKLFPRIGR